MVVWATLMPRLLPLLLVYALCPGRAAATGSDASLQVEWKGPRRCPSGQDVLDGTHQLLRGSRSPTPASPIRARGEVRRGTGGWVLDLWTSQGALAGQRRLEAGNCKALAEAASLILALMVDPQALSSVSPEAPELLPPEAPEAPEPLPPEAPAPAPAPPEPAASAGVPPLAEVSSTPAPLLPSPLPPSSPASGVMSLRALVALGALADVGALPEVGLGPRLEGGFEAGSLRLSASGHLLLSRSVSLPLVEGARGRVGLWAAGLRGSWSLQVESMRLAPTLGAEVGRVRSTTSGVSQSGQGQAWWWAVSTGVGASLGGRGGPRPRLELEAVIPLYRPAFSVEGLGLFHRARPLMGRLSILLELFP